MTPERCTQCGSNRVFGIDWEYDSDIEDDVPYGWRCEACGYCESTMGSVSSCELAHD